MNEPLVINTPTYFPHCCAQCKGATGPLVDTHVEDRFQNRLYLCVSCIRMDARALGLVKGDRQTELLASAQHAAEGEKELEKVVGQRDKARAELGEQRKLTAELVESVEWAQQRIAQLESAIGEDAKAKLEMVGG